MVQRPRSRTSQQEPPGICGVFYSTHLQVRSQHFQGSAVWDGRAHSASRKNPKHLNVEEKGFVSPAHGQE